MLRCVLDTDVVIAAMRSPSGASAAILLTAMDNPDIRLLVSVPLVLEYEAKCLLPEHWQAAGFTLADAYTFLDTVVDLMEPVRLDFRWRPQLHDPGDEMVLETAINGQADVLVTFNVRDYAKAPQSFGIEVLRPVDTLRRIRA